MPGPPPKNPATRQRRNRKPSAAALSAAPSARNRPLPARDDGSAWHPQAIALWIEAWASPMADEYLEADIPGLLILVDLTHLYWSRPSAKTASELRQQRIAYGLDPMARRRLQWEVARAEAVRQPKSTTPTKRTADPRLRLVSTA